MIIVSDQPDKLTFRDPRSNSSLNLFYRRPTPKEYAQYTNGLNKRVRNKVITTVGENRQKWGKKILKGFGDNELGIEVQGKITPVSSNSESPGYREDWKDWFCKNHPAFVERLAIEVFEAGCEEDDGEDLPDDIDDDQGGAPGADKEDTDPN